MSSVMRSAAEIGIHFGHELLHPLAAVITGDVVVQVFPQTLDAVVIGAVRRQKVQLHPAAD